MNVKMRLNQAIFAAVLGLAGGANAQKMPNAAASTQSLFRYTRNDNAPGNITRVRINAAHRAAHKISPNVFGNFFEYLGGVLFPNTLAGIVYNPDLESDDVSAKAPNGWTLENAVWQADGVHSPHCVRLSGKGTAGAASELRQDVFYPAYRNVAFKGTVYLRAVGTPGSVIVEIRAAQIALFRTTLRADSGEWKRRDFTVKLPPESVKRGEAAQLVVRHAGGGDVDCDRIELTPIDAAGVISPDTAQKAKEWDIPILRWPGGNFASGYEWRDGIGPQDTRPTRRNAAWGGLEWNSLGTDEFLKFCEFLHCQPQITVNAGNGAAENAAAWVAYCNANTDAPGMAGKQARLRAANGHKTPYRVHTWEIGNELYGGWQIGHTDATGNAARFVQFRDAMREVDPTIAVIATGKSDEFTGNGLERNAAWNGDLLSAAIANNGAAPDWISMHPLIPFPGSLNGQTYEAQYESAMAHPAFVSDTMLPTLERQITEIEGPNAKTKIAPTEWGIIVGGRDWEKTPNHDSLAGAIFNALTLNAFLRHSDWVTLANMTAFAHGGGIKKRNGLLYVDPQYYTQQVFAQARPQIPLETVTDGPGRDVPQRGNLPAVPNVPDVDVTAALSANKSLVAFAVNRHLTEARTVTFTIDGFAARHCSAVQLTGDTAREKNTIEAPDHIAPKPFPLPLSRLRPGASFQITIPPHTFIALTFAP